MEPNREGRLGREPRRHNRPNTLDSGCPDPSNPCGQRTVNGQRSMVGILLHQLSISEQQMGLRPERRMLDRVAEIGRGARRIATSQAKFATQNQEGSPPARTEPRLRRIKGRVNMVLGTQEILLRKFVSHEVPNYKHIERNIGAPETIVHLKGVASPTPPNPVHP